MLSFNPVYPYAYKKNCIRNLFNISKENEAIKDRIIRDINNLFKQEDYYKPVSAGSFYSNYCIEDESDRNKTLSIEEYLDKTRPSLKDK